MPKRLLAGLWILLFTAEPSYAPLKARLEPADRLAFVWSDAQLVSYMFGDCGRPCVIHQNLGGYLVDFGDAVEALTRLDVSLVIDGDCFSACAFAADMFRARTCVTPRAVFLFHKARTATVVRIGGRQVVDEKDFDDPPHSLAVTKWVKANGGFPASGWTTMRYPHTTKFWKMCGGDAPLPRPDPRRR